jgi:hypothetical protein
LHSDGKAEQHTDKHSLHRQISLAKDKASGNVVVVVESDIQHLTPAFLAFHIVGEQAILVRCVEQACRLIDNKAGIRIV